MSRSGTRAVLMAAPQSCICTGCAGRISRLSSDHPLCIYDVEFDGERACQVDHDRREGALRLVERALGALNRHLFREQEAAFAAPKEADEEVPW